MAQFEKAVEEAREAARLEPNHPLPLVNLGFSYIGLNRLEEGKAILEKAIERGVDDMATHLGLYLVAVAEGDRAAMERHSDWARGNPEEVEMLRARAGEAASAGQLERARDLYQKALESDQQRDFREGAAATMAQEALAEASFGNRRRARKQAQAALAMSRGVGPQLAAALALAWAGATDQAQTIANELQKRFPSNTLLNARTLPTIRASIKLQQGNPARAVELLRTAVPFEAGTGYWGPELEPIYVRALAYLQEGSGEKAAAEFQKFLDFKGITIANPLRPLAHLGLARAYALSGDNAQSRKAYQDFLALWKDADSDIPVLREAKGEYTKLQESAAGVPAS
jgi:tetratricopeptide (TPR) repeat protein